jgi:hypothetical protein
MIDFLPENLEKIEEIKKNIECPKGFRCLKLNVEDLCRARDLGMDNYLECNDKTGVLCAFSISFGDSLFCKCPMRVYIKKKYNE